jgi:hypothetical protein
LAEEQQMIAQLEARMDEIQASAEAGQIALLSEAEDADFVVTEEDLEPSA